MILLKRFHDHFNRRTIETSDKGFLISSMKRESLFIVETLRPLNDCLASTPNSCYFYFFTFISSSLKNIQAWYFKLAFIELKLHSYNYKMGHSIRSAATKYNINNLEGFCYTKIGNEWKQLRV